MPCIVSFAPWVLLPVVVLSRALAFPLPVTTASSGATIRSLHIDGNRTAQASVLVSCPNCIVAPSTSSAQLLDLSLDFSIVPGSKPCSSNLSLNSVPLDLAAPWAFEPTFARGSANLNASGHGLIVDWYKACIDAEGNSSHPIDPAQVLSLTVNSIDGRRIEIPSLAGFTVSFKDANTVQLLRLESPPVNPSEIDITWSNPPPDLRIALPKEIEDSIKDSVLKDHLRDLQGLEADLDHLKKIIKDKKQTIANLLVSDLKEEVENCEGFWCVVKALLHHVRQSAHLLYHKLHGETFSGREGLSLGSSQHSQKPTMIASVPSEKNETNITVTAGWPTKPEKCYCRDEKKGNYLQLKDEPKDDGFHAESHFRDTPPSKIWIVLQFFLLITGLALIFRLVRRCFTTPQKARDRAARREQRRTEREYRYARRRQAFWDWMKGRKRGNPGRRPGDFEEKSALVGQQEAYLEEHMQDEIRQLKIHEEIRHLQSTREAVTDMIRAAEEGRGAYIGPGSPAVPPYNTNPFLDSSPYHTAPVYTTAPSIPAPSYPATNPFANQFTTIPRPITIPPRAQNLHDPGLASPTSSSDIPFSPLSRTTSLPSYRSKPPSYREEASSDGFSSDSEGHSTDGDWAHSDNSSIPDLSPRPSGETIRTFGGETIRTFL